MKINEMSADDLLFDADLAPAKAIEPARGWKNHWVIYVDMGDYGPPGQEWSVNLIYPSKDIAESRARADLDEHIGAGVVWEDYLEYLGAFPVDE